MIGRCIKCRLKKNLLKGLKMCPECAYKRLRVDSLNSCVPELVDYARNTELEPVSQDDVDRMGEFLDKEEGQVFKWLEG